MENAARHSLQARVLAAACVWVLLPGLALANAGTPLMWASMFHLVLGNLLIGIGEGALLNRLLGYERYRGIAAMVAANYLSAWAGGWLLYRLDPWTRGVDLYSLGTVFFALLFMMFLLTLLIEFPFAWLIFRNDRPPMKRLIGCFLVVQLTSYLLMTLVYWGTSSTSLITENQRVRLDQMNRPRGFSCAYIGINDGDVWIAPTAGEQEATCIYDLNSTRSGDRLLLLPSPGYGYNWSLVARIDSAPDRPDWISIIDNVASGSADDLLPNRSYGDSLGNTVGNHGRALFLADPDQSAWRFRSDFWSWGGIHGYKTRSGHDATAAIETPLISLPVRNATQIAGPLVVFQLGDRQICLFDAEKRQVARLAWGRGPAVFPTP